jgi:hypothetical protein
MNAVQLRNLRIAVKESHQKQAGPAGLACELIKTARTPVDRLERAEHGLRALEGLPKYRGAVELTRAAAEVTGTTPSRGRMLAAGISAMTLGCSPTLVASALYAACPRGQELPLARLLLEKTESPHEELAQAVLRNRSLSDASKHEMFSRFLDRIEPRDNFKSLAAAAEGLVSGRLGWTAQAEAARLALRECAKAAPDEEQRSLCQLGSRLVEQVSPKLGARFARAILDDLAFGHQSKNNELLVEALVAKATGADRVITERETERWLQSR